MATWVRRISKRKVQRRTWSRRQKAVCWVLLCAFTMFVVLPFAKKTAIVMYVYAVAPVSYAQTKLRSGDVAERCAAAHRLGLIGASARSALPDLLAALQDESPEVVVKAAWALGCIDGHMDAGQKGIAVTALTECLKHDDGEVRRYSAAALASYGPSAASAIPQLTATLNDPHMGWTAAQSLGEMAPHSRSAVPEISKLLSSPRSGDRACAAWTLSRLQPLPDETVAAIRPLVDDGDPLVRDLAMRAVAKLPMGPTGVVK